MTDRVREPPRRRRLRTMGAVEAQRETHDDALRIVAVRDRRQARGEGLLGRGGHGRERLGDGLGGIAERHTDTLRTRIDGEDPQNYGFGVGDGPAEGVAVGVGVVVGTAPDSTT